jgi:hypothetical protein
MKRVEIIDHKSEYDKLQQMEYDELYKLLKEYGNAIWDDVNKNVLNQDPPIITVMIEGTYFCQDAEVLVASLSNDEIVLEVLPQNSYETYTVRNIKDCVAYYNIHYITESYADFLNSEDYNAE